MEYLVIGITIVALFLFFFFKEYFDSRKRLKKLLDKAGEAFGTKQTRTYSADDLYNIRRLFERYRTEDCVDDITANDLEIDEIFKKYNSCLSAPGSEYFYYKLRSPEFNHKISEDFDSKVEFFRNNEEERTKFQAFFLNIGNMRKVSFFECLDFFDTIERKSLLREYISIAVFIASIVAILFKSTYGIVLLVADLIYNIVSYYGARGTIEPYILCLKYIINFTNEANRLSKEKCDILSDELEKLGADCKELSKLTRNAASVTGKSQSATGTGNPLELFADYFRMVFHIDIIRFYHMLDEINVKRDIISGLYYSLGKIETYIAVASMRNALPSFCKPSEGKGIEGTNMFHPLIDNPVTNSIKADRCVLITGSNASGKSTFLKTVALNAILAKTINTCTADFFSMDDYHVFSSMSLRDDIQNEDSYFMVEIKALKRIFDYADRNPSNKVLCFVDEVLRGTNTIERIAACTQIMENISARGIKCFAATHDIELTELLSDCYDNYHFDEVILENDIQFNYLLKDGRATSRNAIKLLSIMGFSDEIVSKARDMAESFIKDNVWRK